jgi:hypothetical protein
VAYDVSHKGGWHGMAWWHVANYGNNMLLARGRRRPSGMDQMDQAGGSCVGFLVEDLGRVKWKK